MADYDWWWEGKGHHSQVEDRVLTLLSFSFVEEEFFVVVVTVVVGDNLSSNTVATFCVLF